MHLWSVNVKWFVYYYLKFYDICDHDCSRLSNRTPKNKLEQLHFCTITFQRPIADMDSSGDCNLVEAG